MDVLPNGYPASHWHEPSRPIRLPPAKSSILAPDRLPETCLSFILVRGGGRRGL